MNIVPTENKDLPEFLQKEASSSNVIPFAKPEQAEHHYSRKPLLIITAVWFGLLFLYIQFALGWSGLTALLPTEFVTFLAGAFLSWGALAVFVVWLQRSILAVNQASLVEQSLKKVLNSQNENMLSEVITQALQKQIKLLTAATAEMSEQTKKLKSALDVKAKEFAEINEALNAFAGGNLDKLSESANGLVAACQNVATTAEQSSERFAASSEQLKTNAAALVDDLNPLINETVSTAEYLKNALQEDKSFISEANAELENFAAAGRKHIEDMAAIFESNGKNLEKTFLQTADGCEEIYKRLDSGISHIENSLKTHKELAAEQSALLDKNSTYLDSKLGEYGRLISLEVEAMIARSSTLENNVKAQLSALNEARAGIDRILDGANNSLEQKSDKAVKNIAKIVANLESELTKLNEFIKKTENKNTEIQTVAEKITHKIAGISSDLGKNVDDLKLRAVEAIDKFNEVSGEVNKNTAQLTESANVIVAKGKEGAMALEAQSAHITQAVNTVEEVKAHIAQIGKALNATAENSATIFAAYKNQIDDFGSLVNKQVEMLNESRAHSEQELSAIRQKYEDLSVDNFLERSSGLIQNLENISIDINKLFNKDEDELWKKFYDGDHGVFARYVVKNLNRKQIVKIRDEYEKNTDFRKIADSYISDFESLMTAARNAEKPEILLAMLSNTDVGKIYYVIARALDRIN